MSLEYQSWVDIRALVEIVGGVGLAFLTSYQMIQGLLAEDNTLRSAAPDLQLLWGVLHSSFFTFPAICLLLWLWHISFAALWYNFHRYER